jgi:hypothetical protein
MYANTPVGIINFDHARRVHVPARDAVGNEFVDIEMTDSSILTCQFASMREAQGFYERLCQLLESYEG